MFNPIKLFFYSFHEPKTFPLIIRQSILPIFFYAAGCYLLFALFISAWFTLSRFPLLKENLTQVLESLQTTYPQNLVITLNQAQLSLTGVEEPVSFTLPANSPIPKTNLLVIDTQKSAQKLSLEDTLVFASANAFGLNLPTSPDPLIIPYRQLNLNGSLQSAEAVNLIDSFINGLNSVSPLTLSLSFALFLFFTFFPSRLIYALFTSLILSLFNSLNHTSIKFISYGKLTLITLVTAEAINVVTIILYGQLTPIVFTLAFFGYTTVGVYALIKTEKNTAK